MGSIFCLVDPLLVGDSSDGFVTATWALFLSDYVQVNTLKCRSFHCVHSIFQLSTHSISGAALDLQFTIYTERWRHSWWVVGGCVVGWRARGLSLTFYFGHKQFHQMTRRRTITNTFELAPGLFFCGRPRKKMSFLLWLRKNNHSWLLNCSRSLFLSLWSKDINDNNKKDCGTTTTCSAV